MSSKWSALAAALSVAFTLALATTAGALPPSDITALVTGDSATAAVAVEALQKQPVDSLYTWISNFNSFPPQEPGIHAEHRLVNDTLDAPYFVYIPTTYDPSRPTPLFVYLHGGVGREQFPEITMDEWGDDDIVAMCEQQGWLGLFPMGRHDCLWWNLTGMEHIRRLVREMKRRCNVDDDRVMLSGFSDGGSGSFHIAMLMPTDFACLFPWSGNIAVGSLVGGMQVYPRNLRNRTLFASSGGRDGLYPAERMRGMMRFAIGQGADIYFTEYDTAGHNWGYMPLELASTPGRAERFARRPLQPQVYWETSDLRFGRVDWLEITAVDTAAMPAYWYSDDNYLLVDDRVSVGFYRRNDWEGEGMFVDSLVDDPETAAVKAGVMAGDIVIGLNDITVKGMEDYIRWRESARRGDSLRIRVLRDGEEIELQAQLPPPGEYDAFPRETTPAAVEALRVGNHFVVRTSRVGAFRLYLHPEMIRFDQPVQVMVNGAVKFEGSVEPDARFLLEEFRKSGDRRLLWTAKLEVTP